MSNILPGKTIDINRLHLWEQTPLPQVNSGAPYYNTQLVSTGITITNANNTTLATAFNILQPYIVVYTWTRTV
jgi:hypothetical protein